RGAARGSPALTIVQVHRSLLCSELSRFSLADRARGGSGSVQAALPSRAGVISHVDQAERSGSSAAAAARPRARGAAGPNGAERVEDRVDHRGVVPGAVLAR